MGKASRKRAERRAMSPGERKVLKELLKESKPEVFGNNEKITYYNPLKKLLKQEAYKSDEGLNVTNEMVKRYEQFLKAKISNETKKEEK